MQLPLTFQQQWLWALLQQYMDWNCTVAYAFRLHGELSVSVLRRSLREVIRRHGSLRTRIVIVDGVAKQETDDPRAGHFDMTLIAGRSAAEIEERARRIFVEFADLQVDPAAGPLLRVRLLKLSGREHWLLIALHRLTADCFCADQIFRELWSFYGDFLQQRPPALDAEPLQYGEYAIWQHSTSREWAKKHGTYWQKRLAGARNLQWPPDPSAPASTRPGNSRLTTLFGEALSDDLRVLARRSRALIGTVMLAVYVATLWQWCRQKDFVIPFNIAGRQSEHRHVVGYFAHVLYLRMQLTGEETFAELLARVSNEFFRALTHQDFGRIALQEPQLLTGTYFQWVSGHAEETDPTQQGLDAASNLHVQRLPIGTYGDDISACPPGTIDVDLTFFDTPGGIYAAGWYRSDRFSAETMNRFMADLRSTAEHVVRTSNSQPAGADTPPRAESAPDPR